MQVLFYYCVILGLLAIVATWIYRKYDFVAFIINKFVLIAYDDNTKFLLEIFQSLKYQFEVNEYKYQLSWTIIVGKLPDDTFEMEASHIVTYDSYRAVITSKAVCIELFEWNEKTESLLILIASHKSQLPIDNIILKIAIKQINEQIKAKEIVRTCVLLRQKMNQITGFTLPIYLLIDGLEDLEGFEHLIWRLEGVTKNSQYNSNQYHLLDQILGVDQKYVNFDAIHDVFVKLQQILLVQSSEYSRELILFLQVFTQLRESIDIVLKQDLRGCYFTGMYKGKQLFIKQLLNEKVFVERGLSIRCKSVLFTRNYKIRCFQILSVLWCCFLTYRFFVNKNELAINSHKIIPKVEIINDLINKYKNNSVVNKTDYIQDIQLLLLNLPDYNSLFGYTMPIAYLSGLYYKQESMQKKVYQELVINRLYINMNDQLEQLSALPKLLSDGLFISQSSSFKEFVQFVDQLVKVIKAEKDLSRNQPFEKIAEQFYEIELPTIRQLPYKPSVIRWQYNTLRQLWDAKSSEFLKQFTVESIKSKLQNLTDQLNLFTSGKTVNPAILKQELFEVLNWLETEMVKMIDQQFLLIDPAKLYILKDILGTKLIDGFNSQLDMYLKQLKTVLFSMKLPIVGFLAIEDKDQMLHGSTQLYKLLGLLNSLAITTVQQGQFLNFDHAELSELTEKIETIESTDKEIWIKILSGYIESKMFVKTEKSLDDSAIVGYLYKIFEFVKNNSALLYRKMIDVLCIYVNKELKEVWNKINSTLVLSVKLNLSKQTIQSFFKQQAKLIDVILKEKKAIFELLDSLDSDILTANLSEHANNLKVLYKQLEVHDDLSDLGKLIESIWNGSDKKADFSNESSFLQEKFESMKKYVEKVKISKKLQGFNSDFEKIQRFFDRNLKDQEPFGSGFSANASDVLELYALVNKMLEKYDVEWIELYVPTDHLIHKLLNNQKLLESIAKGDELNVKMNIVPWIGIDNITQATVWVNDIYLDFRSKSTSVKLAGITRAGVRIELLKNNDIVFANGQKTMIVEYEGIWAVQRLLGQMLMWDTRYYGDKGKVAVRVNIEQNGIESRMK